MLFRPHNWPKAYEYFVLFENKVSKGLLGCLHSTLFDQSSGVEKNNFFLGQNRNFFVNIQAVWHVTN